MHYSDWAMYAWLVNRIWAQFLLQRSAYYISWDGVSRLSITALIAYHMPQKYSEVETLCSKNEGPVGCRTVNLCKTHPINASMQCTDWTIHTYECNWWVWSGKTAHIAFGAYANFHHQRQKPKGDIIYFDKSSNNSSILSSDICGTFAAR